MDADVMVVGAGLSGLACALRVEQAGGSAVVLEARDRVGGRTLNAPIGGGEVAEQGGQWVGPSHRRVVGLAAEVGVGTFPTHIAGDHLFLGRGRIARYGSDLPRRAPLGLLDYRLAQARLERMARRIDLADPAAPPAAARWDAQTVRTWLARSMRTRSGRELMELTIQAVLAVEADELSLLHWLFYVASGGGLDSLIRTRGGYQQDRFAGGSQEVSVRVAARLGDRVRLRAPVRAIEERSGGIQVRANDVDVSASFVVVALPPALCGAIEFDPPLPAARQQLHQRMPPGAVTKYTAVYADPFWREAGLSGHATATAGPLKLVFDNSPPAGTPGALVGFALGDDARQLAERPERERRAAVLGRLVALFGSRAGRPELFLERSWADDPWARGCYTGVFAPGGWSRFGPALRQPVGRVHWAGSETATVHQGSMDGAVAAGERAAGEVLARLAERPPVSIPAPVAA